MSTTGDTICARDGCTWFVELVLVADMALPTTYCGDACADYEWLRRGLDAMEPAPDVVSLYANLRGIAAALNARTDPTEIGALIDA
uniref:Transposase n=1 Tax=Streptomyces sp. NBC_00008 TaxID=2903610 RepID=A0AAU2VZU0_9ACTN